MTNLDKTLVRPPVNVEQQVVLAYRQMASRARYRPAAPSDGLGGITVPAEELDLDAEAQRYAADWWTQEDDLSFFIGCANHEERTAMVYAVEAARLCCGGVGCRPYARRLLELALQELK